MLLNPNLRSTQYISDPTPPCRSSDRPAMSSAFATAMSEDHMQREQPPPYAQSHDSESNKFPSVPTTDPLVHHERTLPPLPEPRRRPEELQHVWPSNNPLTAYYQPGPSQLSPKTMPSHTSEESRNTRAETPESRGRGGSVLSIDDPDVRMAAEALGDLRADFVGSPPQSNRNRETSPRNFSSAQQPEPLLSLLTTSHPLIGKTIGGSLSAYSASKNYSPRFKSSAEYVERRFTPVVNTVGSVGRITGVEGGVRWFLGGRRPSHHSPSDLENNGTRESHKRRKLRTEEMDIDRSTPHDAYPQELPHRTRTTSQSSTTETLPAYDDHRSPSYESSQQALIRTTSESDSQSPGGSWQSRLVLSTSGLSIAMSEESLRSLKYCLGWLRWANEHIGKVILALKSALEQYDQDPNSNQAAIEGSSDTKALVIRSEADRSALNARIAELKADVLKTLKEVVDIVSKYAGGALPENARVLVRRHLTSLPQRFRLASAVEAGEGGDKEANRVLVLAKEGLDMMSQVSGVLDGTIVSAEEWCERLGKRRREDSGAGVGDSIEGREADWESSRDEKGGEKKEAEKLPLPLPLPQVEDVQMS